MKNIWLLILLLNAPVLWAKERPHPPRVEDTAPIVVKKWVKSLKSGRSKKRYFPEMASPHLQNNVYVGTHSGILYALDPHGRFLWKFESNGPIASQPTVDGERVYFGNNKGMVYALNLASGKEIWNRYLGSEILAGPTLSGGILTIVNTSREVSALQVSDGREVWNVFIQGYEKRFSMRGNSPVVISGDRLFVGFADGQVVSLTRSGEVLWSRQLAETNTPFHDVDASILIDGSFIYATGYFGKLVKMDRHGNTVWQRDLVSGNDLTMDLENIYAASLEGHVLAFNKSDGLRIWEVELNSGALSSLALLKNSLFVGTEKNRAYILNTSDGKPKQVLSIPRGILSKPVWDETGIYLLSSGARLYHFGNAL